MEQELLIWVDKEDRAVGYGTKLETHRLEKLHRAYSVFIYDNSTKKMLLQKRANGKYHSGGLWSNACCSHPYKDESWLDAISRGLKNELRIEPFKDADSADFQGHSAKSPMLRHAGSFYYYSRYAELSEHEIDHVFLLQADGELLAGLDPNPDEVEKLRLMSLDEIDAMLLSSPDAFTSWFRQAYRLAKAEAKALG